jgi:hypothetical protein
MVLAALLLVSAPAAAQLSADETRNAARDLAGQGKASFERGDFEKARDLFHRAYTLVPVPSIAIFEARSLAALGRLVEAEEAYLRASRAPLDANAPDAFRTAVREAEAELQMLRPRIPKLTLALTGEGAQHPELVVKIDGNEVPHALRGVEMPFDPGKHQLMAQAPGGERVQVQFVLAEKEREQVDVHVPAPAQQVAATPTQPVLTPTLRRDEPAPPPRSSWQKPAAFVAGGLGIAGLATGIVTGLMASSRHSTAASSCPDNVCPPGGSGWDDVQSFRTLRTVSTVGYVVGAVGLAGGVTLWLTAPKQSSRAVGVRVTGEALFVEGAF